MKTYYLLCFDGDYGEMVFDSDLNAISYWCADDAKWRGEYFGEFMEHAGVKVVSYKIPKKFHPTLRENAKAYYLDYCGEELPDEYILF